MLGTRNSCIETVRELWKKTKIEDDEKKEKEKEKSFPEVLRHELAEGTAKNGYTRARLTKKKI